MNIIKPIIAIGIDAGEPDLIEKWSQEGKLPTIASLMKTGSYSRIKSFADLSSGVSWSTFSTAVTPAKHGIFYYHRQLKSGTYKIEKVYANETKSEYFWSFPSKAGKRIAIFDIPESYPTENLNGIQIVNWGCEGVNWENASWPPNLFKEVISLYGSSPVNGIYQTKRYDNVSKCEELYKMLSTSVNKRTSISEYMLGKEVWDLFLMIYTESHWAGHHLWHTLDKKHPMNIPEYSLNNSSPVLKIYSEIDSAISQLIKRFPNNTVIIFSIAGMGLNISGSHLIPQILERLGLSEKASDNNHTSFIKKYLVDKNWGPYATKTIEDLIPYSVLEKFRQIIPMNIWDQWTRKVTTLGNNWNKSRAFWLPNGNVGAIRINLIGREPKGLVKPGEEYDSICNKLIEEFSKLVNPETGNKAVSEIIRIDKLFDGKYLHYLPDLIIQWSNEALIKSLYSSSIGTVTGINPDRRPGTHTPYGFLLASGENIKKNQSLQDANLMDIAPTILYLMGQPVPKDMDGKVLMDIVEDKFKGHHTLNYS